MTEPTPRTPYDDAYGNGVHDGYANGYADGKRAAQAFEPLRAALDADTRKLAEVMAAANPWMGGGREFWLGLAAGLKDYLEANRAALAASKEETHG